ncbi:TIGR02530 family flagellar biosynthesis protein [Anaerobranca gottschalkii]|uniref:Flagellar operon protein n=1 Tax=Anaerobranca gottschalkii DSM 13577 TaxID=1120990 RepID=A0A1H9ZDF5_9FIRM|nr:TIGR02530 family flagellar biosynthesis protein [Anaerobranca gottschalkii]SES79516.1 flagellar operon protein [Anaerobranca gottschalkii DSM 13577]
MTKIINPQLLPYNQQKVKLVNSTIKSENFKTVFQQELANLTISKHANGRLEKRGINLDAIELAKLNLAMDKLKEKGSKDSLVLVNGNAYIVNPQKRVIITAIDKDNLKEKIFTEIDSALIL